MRRTIETAVLLLATGLLLRTWCVQGLVLPLLVPTGSMAPTLLGRHRQTTCGDCGFRFVHDAADVPFSDRYECPNCGYAGRDDRPDRPIAGDRLLMDRSAFALRRPRRWEVVAFRQPDAAGRLGVKRVVGLPGERIQIRHGDVYANGVIQRKQPALCRAMAVPVHDAAFRPTRTPQIPPCWRGPPGTRWTQTEGCFAHPGGGAAGSIDWLTYHHQHRLPGLPQRVVEKPVTDVYGYNQSLSRRAEEIHAVGDLLVSFRVRRLSGAGRLWIRASDGREEFKLAIQAGEPGWELLRKGGKQQSFLSEDAPPLVEGNTVEVALFDHRLSVSVGGRSAVLLPYEPGKLPRCPGGQPLAIGSQGLGAEIDCLRVFRDVYYTHPIGPQGRWGLDTAVQVSEDAYFVLGDNSPVSEDSRSWSGGPCVPVGLLVGRPLLVHLPARHLQWGTWQIQVPDAARIRYIR